MGCVKSKHSNLTRSSSSAQKAAGSSGKGISEKATLVCPETRPAEEPSQVSPVLLDYAQRLSEEIVARAIQQWAELDSRYRDIPYIDLP